MAVIEKPQIIKVVWCWNKQPTHDTRHGNTEQRKVIEFFIKVFSFYLQSFIAYIYIYSDILLSVLERSWEYC